MPFAPSGKKKDARQSVPRSAGDSRRCASGSRPNAPFVPPLVSHPANHFGFFFAALTVFPFRSAIPPRSPLSAGGGAVAFHRRSTSPALAEAHREEVRCRTPRAHHCLARNSPAPSSQTRPPGREQRTVSRIQLAPRRSRTGGGRFGNQRAAHPPLHPAPSHLHRRPRRPPGAGDAVGGGGAGSEGAVVLVGFQTRSHRRGDRAEKGDWLHNRLCLFVRQTATSCGACPLFQQPRGAGGDEKGLIQKSSSYGRPSVWCS
jgi:hypothetical protein